MKQRWNDLLLLLWMVLFLPIAYLYALLGVWEEAQRQAATWKAQLTPDQLVAFHLCVEQSGFTTAQAYVEQMSSTVAQAYIQECKQLQFLKNHRLTMSLLTERKIISLFQRAFRLALLLGAEEQEQEQ